MSGFLCNPSSGCSQYLSRDGVEYVWRFGKSTNGDLALS